MVPDVMIGELAAQVQQVLAAGHGRIGKGVNGCEADLQEATPGRIGLNVANHHAIECGRNARAGELRVVNAKGGLSIPDHARSGHEMLLKVVGVNFNETRNEPVALQIHCSGQRAYAL